MPKIIAIDYGKNRTGFAITDETKTFAFGLCTQKTSENINYLKNLVPKENIDTIVVGLPRKLNNDFADIATEVLQFIEKVKRDFNDIKIIPLDERYTSKMAFQSMIDSGMKKKDRRNKALVDEIAATILLQNYLEYKH